MEKQKNVPTAKCPKCGRDIPRTWDGKENNVFYCNKCPLLVATKKDKRKQGFYDAR